MRLAASLPSRPRAGRDCHERPDGDRGGYTSPLWLMWKVIWFQLRHLSLLDCLCHRLCYRLLLGSLGSIQMTLLGHREALVKGKVLVAQSQLFATPWTAACQAPWSMRFSRQEYWSGLPFSRPGNLPDPGIEPGSPVLQADSLPYEPPGKPFLNM